MLGFGGAQNGANFNAQGTALAQPLTSSDGSTAYNAANAGIGQQQAFLQALQGQNGIGNQSSVFNQLQGVANGTGPNPAATMLANQTGVNNANQAALMAGQRGAGANPALIARQAAMQGAANQQNSVGQAANLQANQSLNALNSMGSLATQQVGQQAGALSGYNSLLQGQEGTALGQLNAQNNSNVQMQSNQNNANAGIANTNAGAQYGLINGVISGAATAGTSGATSGAAPKVAQAGAGGATGGQIGRSGFTTPTGHTDVKMFAFGGAPASPTVGNSSNPQSRFGQAMSQFGSATPTSGGAAIGSGLAKGIGAGFNALFGNQPSGVTMQNGTVASSENNFGAAPLQMPTQQFGQQSPTLGMDTDLGVSEPAMAKGGKAPVKAILSPGERYLSPDQVKKVASGEEDAMKVGKKVPGKASVKGDSYANDTVPATLQQGGDVIPRHITQSKDASEKAAEFVRAILRKQGSL